MEHVLRSHSKAFSLNYSLLYNQWFYLGVNKILLQSVTALHQICSGTGAKTEALGRSYCIVYVIFQCTHAEFFLSAQDMEMLHTEHALSRRKLYLWMDHHLIFLCDICSQGQTFAWIPTVFQGKFLVVVDVCQKCS